MAVVSTYLDLKTVANAMMQARGAMQGQSPNAMTNVEWHDVQEYFKQEMGIFPRPPRELALATRPYHPIDDLVCQHNIYGQGIGATFTPRTTGSPPPDGGD